MRSSFCGEKLYNKKGKGRFEERLEVGFPPPHTYCFETNVLHMFMLWWLTDSSWNSFPWSTVLFFLSLHLQLEDGFLFFLWFYYVILDLFQAFPLQLWLWVINFPEKTQKVRQYWLKRSNFLDTTTWTEVFVYIMQFSKSLSHMWWYFIIYIFLLLLKMWCVHTWMCGCVKTWFQPIVCLGDNLCD